MANTVQSAYAASIPVGYPGMVANGETSNRLSRTVEDAAGLGFGKAAFRGVNDHGVTGTPGTQFMGVTIANHGVQALVGGAADTYPQYATAGLLNEGEIFVLSSTATTDGAAVYVTPAGLFSATSSGNTAIPAAFDDTLSAAGIVRLRVAR